MTRRLCLILSLFLIGSADGDSDKLAHMNLQPAGVAPALEIVSRLGYALGYDPKIRQSRWVAYRLKKEDLTHQFPRNESFKLDDAVSNSPDKYDYSGSDFDRGHMAPADEMEYHFDRMEDSFYMSNMCPQYHHINAGEWLNVEKFVRNAARRFGEVFVVSGPIFAETGGTFGDIPMKNEKKAIKNANGDIPIPDAFFKVIYTSAHGGMMLAFQIDNAEDNIGSYLMHAKSVRAMESITGYRFFPDLDPDDDEGLRDMDSPEQWF